MAITRLAAKRFQGLSTDTKPTLAETGAEFLETDTNARFVYNGSTWLILGFNNASTIADVFVYRDATRGFTSAFSASGTVHSRLAISGDNDDTVIQAAITNTPVGGTLCILPASDRSAYVVGEHTGAMTLNNNITILAYGTKFRGGVTTHHGAIWWICNVAGLDVRFFGGEYNAKSITTAEAADGTGRIYATIFGSGYDKVPHLLHLKDLTIKDFQSNGVSIFPPAGGLAPSATAYGTVIIENCMFDTSPNVTFKPQNECIVCANNVENFVINNTYMNHFKGWFVIAENLKMDNCTVNAGGWGVGSTGSNNSSMAQNVELKNIRLLDCAMTVRMHGNPDDSLPIGSCKNVVIDGFMARNIQGAIFYPIQIRGYYHAANTTYYNVENVTISNAYFDFAPIIINKPTSATIAAKVKHLTLKNVYFNDWGSTPALVYVTDQNIDFLEMDGIYINAGWGSLTNPAAVKLYADNITCTVARASVQNIYPAPVKTNNEHLGYITADSGLTATIAFDRPLVDNSNNCIFQGTGTGTEVFGFNDNWGTAQFTGTATTTAFNIAHQCSTTPTHFEVKSTSADAVGPFTVAADATNLTITYAIAPPSPSSGSNNLTYTWRARIL